MFSEGEWVNDNTIANYVRKKAVVVVYKMFIS